MPASITDKYKRLLLDGMWRSFYNLDVDSDTDSDRYFVGIGKSEAWTNDESPPAPGPDQKTITEFQEALQGVKLITDLSYVVPRYNWSAGSVYSAWSPTYHSDTTVGALQDIPGPYYVITEEQNVYVCLKQGKTDEGATRNSLYKPTSVSAEPFEAGPDGYLWKWLYNVGVYNARRYLTSEWMPVERIEDSTEGGPATDALSASRLAQVLNQYVAVDGEVINIEVTSGGSGYQTAPDVNIFNPGIDSLSGTPARAYARINSAGEVFEIIMKDSAGAENYSLGANYDHRTYVTLTGGNGSGATAIANVYLDSGGMANDPRNDLNASALMYTARIIGDEENVFDVNSNFRQVGLIRNMTVDSLNDSTFAGVLGDSDFSKPRGNSLRKLYVGPGIDDEFTNLDNTVTGQTSGAVASLNYYREYIDSDCCDSTQNTTHNVLYVHQNITTGYGSFVKGEVVELSDNGGTATIIAHADSDIPALRWADVDGMSGEVLYVDNRVPIDRDEDQTEDIKIVIDL